MAGIPSSVPATGAFAGFTPASMAVAAGAYGVDNQGDIQLTTSVNSTMEFTSIDVINGSILVNALPGAGLQHSFGYEISTDINLSISSVSVMVYNNHSSINGDAPIVFNIAAVTDKSSNINGLVNVDFNVTGGIAYGAVSNGDIQNSLSIGSVMSHWNYERIDPSVILKSGSIDQTTDTNSGGINPTIDTNTGSIGVTT